MYYIIQPIVSRNAPEWAETATMISRHRTKAAAETKIATANRRLRAQPGQATSWVDWHIVPASALSASKRAAAR